MAATSPTKLAIARREGQDAFARAGMTHTEKGLSVCPYSAQQSELRRAWLEGYDFAAKRAGRTI